MVTGNFLSFILQFLIIFCCYDGAFEYFFAQVVGNLKNQILKSSNFRRPPGGGHVEVSN